MRQNISSMTSIISSKKEIEQLPQKELDRYIRIRVVNEMIHQLEKIRSRSRERKNDIIRVESFLNDLTAPLGKKNEQLQHRIVKTQNKPKLTQTSNIQKKIKKIGLRSSLIIMIVTLQLFSLIFLVTDLGLIQQSELVNINPVSELKSNYIIQNLKGDTIDTFLSWRLVENDVLYVNIVNAHKYPEKVETVKDVILSTEVIEIDNSLTHKGLKGTTSTYYLGWIGALEKSSQTPTSFYIPKKLEVIDSATGAGDITIKLVNHRSGDGFSGWTKSIADESQNQILKSEITIFDVDNLTDNQLSAITRHELGHAFGLAHSTAPEDLMAPTMTTEFPYISPCDIDAIISLYDGEKLSQVECKI